MRNSIMCIIVILSLYSIFSICCFIYNEYANPLQTSSSQFISIQEPPSNDSNHPIKSAKAQESLTLDKEEEPSPEIDPILNNPLFLEEYSESIEYEPPESSCKVRDLYFTEDEYTNIFQFKKFGPCTTPTDDVIYLEDDYIFAQCVNTEPLFSVDPGLPQILGGENQEAVEWTSDPSIGPKSEYAFIKCGESLYSLFFLRFNQSIADRANQIRKAKKHDPSPMNVMVMVIDSVSRFTTYKYMPKLTELMRKRIQNPSQFLDFSVYEFKKMGLPEIYTIPNAAQLLYGVDFEKIRKILNVAKPKTGEPDSEKHISYQREKAIWNYYSRLGYTTLFLADTIFDFVTRFIGRQIQADHVFANYWRPSWTVYGYNDFSNQQRCMGRQNSHNLTFGYIHEFFEKYSDNNKFAYVHLDAAHESSGNIQTVDAELVDFIESLYKLMQKRNENLVFWVMSDHGFKFAPLMFDVRSFTENTSPMSYFMISKRVEKKLNARENLIHNSEMLTGRFDGNLVLKYLAHFPYELPNKSYFEDIRKEYGVKSVVNLLTEKVSPTRECSDLGVADNRCICSWFVPIDVENAWEKKIIKKSKGLIQNYLEITAEKSPCMKMENIKLIGGQKFNIHDMSKGKITFFELSYIVNNSTKVEAKFNFCYKNRVKRGMNILKGKLFPFIEYSELKDTAFLQLTNINTDGSCSSKNCVC